MALAAVFYIYRDSLIPATEKSTWDFVPNTAAMVWEPSNAVESWNKYLETDHWKNFKSIRQVQAINNGLVFLDSLTGRQGLISEITQRGQFLLSVHTISSTAFDFVYYVSLEDPRYQEAFLQAADRIREESKAEHTSRVYSGQSIQELKKGDKTFSYVLIDNMLAGSFSPFLIEDVIRVSNNPEMAFLSGADMVENTPSLEFDAGNIYLNMENFESFMGLFSERDESPLQDFIRSIQGIEFLDIDFDNAQFYLNGFLDPSGAGYLDVFARQQPVELDFEGMIPENSSIVFYQSFTDASTWHEDLRGFLSESEADRMDQLAGLYEFNLERMLNWTQNHVVASYQQSVEKHVPRLLLVGTSDPYESMNQLTRLSEKVNEQIGDTLYFESYGETPIYLLNLPEFPASIFGDWYRGFRVSYFAAVGNFVAISDDIEVIKDLINDRDDQYTWQHSITTMRFMEQSLTESNIGLFIHVPNALGYLENNLSDAWKDFFMQNLQAFRQLNLVGVQYSNFGDRYYSSIITQQRDLVTRRAPSSDIASVDLVLDTTIAVKPKVVRNHVNNTREVLVLEANGSLTLTNDSGEPLWSRQVGKDVSEIHQIDYFKNGKLQYLLAADSVLYLIDRNGEDVEGFPKPIAFDFAKMLVIDYDRSRNYRYLFSDSLGNAFITDKEANILEGWAPRPFEDQFTITPFHLRVRSKDIFLAILDGGQVVVTNRRGEMQQGFPLDLGQNVSGDVYYRVRGGLKETQVTVVSDEGLLMTFNLQGEIVQQTQLYKPSTRTRFELVKEAQNKSFVLLRQDEGRVAVVGRNDKVRFEKDFPSSNNVGLQYYNFGLDRELFFIRNVEPGVILVYDGAGDFKSSRMLGDYPVSVLHRRAAQRFDVYTGQSNHLLKYTLQE